MPWRSQDPRALWGVSSLRRLPEEVRGGEQVMRNGSRCLGEYRGQGQCVKERKQENRSYRQGMARRPPAQVRGRGGDVSTSRNHRAKDAGAVPVAFRQEEQEALVGKLGEQTARITAVGAGLQR